MSTPEFCPMEQTEDGNWIVRGHGLVKEVALNDRGFSSSVSRFLQVPNGMDGREHTAFRALTDRYLTPARVTALVPALETIAEEVVGEALAEGQSIDAVTLGTTYAVRAASAWLGWPSDLEDELVAWVHANWEATRSGELSRTAEVANWYNQIIAKIMESRRETRTNDVTAELMRDSSLGRLLTDEEITSVLRNWTGGDLGSLAMCVGVVLAYLADHEDLQAWLRTGVSDSDWRAVLDEILRMNDPFLANRRVAVADIELGEYHIEAGQRLTLSWVAANQDPSVFGENDNFDPETHAAENLVYGIGRHVCPGRDLATTQLRIIIDAALQATGTIVADPARNRIPSDPPAGGFASVPLQVR